MKPLMTLLWLVAAVALIGCKTIRSPVDQPNVLRSHPPLGPHALVKPFSSEQTDGLFHMSCTDKFPDGRSVFASLAQDDELNGRIALARRYFIYAAMANNSYRDPPSKPRFATPGWEFEYALESGSGLAAEVYREVGQPELPGRLVVAFRGTEPHLNDWKTNFSLREPLQFQEAVLWMQKIRDENPLWTVVATGHSLGGAIALNLSMRFPRLDAVAFNSSPRAFFGEHVAYDNQRVYIYEYGEFLSLFGSWYLKLRLPSGVVFGNFNFLDYLYHTVSIIPEHSIYELTRALTLVALSAGEGSAYQFFRENISEGDAIKFDPIHCQYIYDRLI